MLLAIDPGSSESAYVLFDKNNASTPLEVFEKVHNDKLLSFLRLDSFLPEADLIAIEAIASYGMPVGKEIFDTCIWIGRFIEASRLPFRLIYRKDVKMYLCNSMRAKDTNIRQALIDKFEPGLKPKERPKGILKGVSKDVWSAVAIAVYASEVKP
jgi:hypothetical protein